MMTYRHLYEIAKIKSQDEMLDILPLQEVVQKVAYWAHEHGVKIVHEIDPAELKVFLKERAKIIEEQRIAEEEALAAKVLRIQTPQ